MTSDSCLRYSKAGPIHESGLAWGTKTNLSIRVSRRKLTIPTSSPRPYKNLRHLAKPPGKVGLFVQPDDRLSTRRCLRRAPPQCPWRTLNDFPLGTMADMAGHATGSPRVAMPFPDDMGTRDRATAVVGCVPRTVGIIGGRRFARLRRKTAPAARNSAS